MFGVGGLLSKKRIVSENTVGTVRTAWTLFNRLGKSKTPNKGVNVDDAKNIENATSEHTENAKPKPTGTATATVTSQGAQPLPVIITFPEVTAFMENCMLAVGTKPEHGKQLAEVLIDADYRGHFSHGINRLGKLTGVQKCYH